MQQHEYSPLVQDFFREIILQSANTNQTRSQKSSFYPLLRIIVYNPYLHN